MIALCPKNYTKYENKPCGQNVELYIAIPGDT